MALSVLQVRNGPEWPLGFVQVANNGVPVSIMVNVDANNTNAPETQSNKNTSEYTTTCRSIVFQGVKPNANNNGLTNNTGNVYILVPSQNGAVGNKSDYGCTVGVIAANGGAYALPASLASDMRLSPYRYRLDADVSGEGALVTIYGPQGQ